MIKKIEVSHFKGVSHRVEEFGLMPKFINGANGAGKTSLLEAIRYALTGKTPTREEILFKGEESGFVAITFDDADETEIKREFFTDGKPTKVRVNGKATTAKSAQELICSLLDTNEQYLDLNTSQDVFREMLKGELGKFLLSFVPESFTPDKLFDTVEFSEAEKEELRKNLPETFGLDECEALYKDFYERRASLKTLVQKTEARISVSVEKPERTIEEVEKELATILAREKIAESYAEAVKSYEIAFAAHQRRLAEIARLEEEIANITTEEVDPLLKGHIKSKQQETMAAKAAAQGMVSTLQKNIAMFEKTLANLSSNVCPLSSKLVCTTDKTTAKAEFEELIAQNKAAVEKQNEIIASCDVLLKDLAEKEAAIALKERAIEKKNNLLTSLNRAKKTLGEAPVKPAVVATPDMSKKPKLLKEKENIFKYNEYLKYKADYDKYVAELDLISSLTKKFAPKGVVTEGVIGHYCEIFNDEVSLLADAIGYKVTFVPHKGLSCLVCPGNDKKPVMFDNLSTGEQLITVVIIQHLCNTLSGCNIMLIDNFNDLDEVNTRKFKDIVNELATEYSLLVVTGTNI